MKHFSEPLFFAGYLFLLLITYDSLQRWHQVAAFSASLPQRPFAASLASSQLLTTSLEKTGTNLIPQLSRPLCVSSSAAANESTSDDAPVTPASVALDHPIILFDGVCNFCNAWVDVLLRIDRKGIYRFTPLQSQLGQRLLQSIGKEKDDISSVLLIEADGRTYYSKSECVLQVIRQLGPVASFASRSITFMLPESVRNGIYDMVAENRYNFLGERNTCRSGDPIYFDRFLS
jgi:predicted DCC family thiol-disulfide oxidoreductase YuxK